MTVAFRVDAAIGIGTGHVVRCLTLARGLAARGWQAVFLMRDEPGHLGALVADAGCEIRWLSGRDPVESDRDAAATRAALDTLRPAWLVIDHYHLAASWERAVKDLADHLLVIDDLADRPHHCDVLLDQNVPINQARYRSLTPEHASLLCGPSYALLGPAFAPPAFDTSRARTAVQRVLVAFGGTDPLNLTTLAIEALSLGRLGDLDVDVAVGATCPHRDRIEAAAAVRPRTQVHQAPRDLAALLDRADLALGAGGGSLWERCRAGVPAVVMSAAANQRASCEWLEAEGIIAHVGDGAAATASRLAAHVSAVIQDARRRLDMARRGRTLVDGRGVDRVVAAIERVASERRVARRHSIHAARICPEPFDGFALQWIDQRPADEVLGLRNAEHVRAQMRDAAPITAAEHARFLSDYHRADRVDFVIVDTTQDRGVGAVYVTDLAGQPAIGKYIGNPAYLRKGLARKSMTALLSFAREHLGVRRMTAVTRTGNLRNQHLNHTLGFVPVETRGGYLTMAMEL